MSGWPSSSSAQGRWRSAQTQLTAAEQLRPEIAREQRALILAAPFLERPRSELEAARADVASTAGEPEPADYVVLAPLNGMHRLVRAYLTGVLDARLGETGTAARSAALLDSLALAAASGSEARAFGQALATTVRAHAEIGQGKRGEALEVFDRGRLTLVSEGLLLTAVGAQVPERYLRGEILSQMGRPRDALAWYAASGETMVDQIAYLAPAHLRQAEMYERLGEPQQAREHYRKFVQLWQDCDPELRPMVDAARIKAGFD